MALTIMAFMVYYKLISSCYLTFYCSDQSIPPHNSCVYNIQICEELVERLNDYGQIGCDEETLKVTIPCVQLLLYSTLSLLYRIT